MLLSVMCWIHVMDQSHLLQIMYTPVQLSKHFSSICRAGCKSVLTVAVQAHKYMSESGLEDASQTYPFFSQLICNLCEQKQSLILRSPHCCSICSPKNIQFTLFTLMNQYLRLCQSTAVCDYYKNWHGSDTK